MNRLALSREPQRIAMLRLSALGDCVMALPVASALRERFPKAHIAWVIQDNNLPLIQNLQTIDEAIVFPRSRWKSQRRSQILREMMKIRRHLRLRRFNVCIDVQSNSKSALLAWFSGCSMRIGHGGEEAREISGWLHTQAVSPREDQPHIAQRNLNLLSALGIDELEPRFDLPTDRAGAFRVQQWLHQKGLNATPYLFFVPCCGRPEKELPVETLATMIRSLIGMDIPVVLQHTPGRDEETNALIQQVGDSRLKMGPQTSIPDLVEWIRHAGMVVGGDTGPLQIAGALAVPNVAWFGPTDPARLHPWHASTIVSMNEPAESIARHVESRWKSSCHNPAS